MLLRDGENRSGTRGAAHAVAVGERRAGFGCGMTHHFCRCIGRSGRVGGSTGPRARAVVTTREWGECAPLARTRYFLGEKK